jgi:hypothetical protein
MNSKSSQNNLDDKKIFNKLPSIDIIAILDESGSMEKMGNEPWQAINIFVHEQLKNCKNDNTTFSLTTFNNTLNERIVNVRLNCFTPLTKNDYSPSGTTSLNDAICFTIDRTLNSNKTNNKVLIIITDGMENGSQYFSTSDSRNRINLVKSKYDWKVIYMGSNVDHFSEGIKLNIQKNRCFSYNQNTQGDFINLCRTTSEYVNNYRRSKSEGTNINSKNNWYPPTPLKSTYSTPIFKQQNHLSSYTTSTPLIYPSFKRNLTINN